jgi:membrane protein
MRAQAVVKLLKNTFQEWQEDKVPLWAAALAYYTIFSIAPILIIAIAVAGAVFGQEAAQGQIVGQIQGLVGRDGAEFIQSMLENAGRPGSGGLVATLFSIATLIFGASGAFGQLQDALNTIWEVKPKPQQAVKGLLRNRFLSFAMVLVIGFLLLVSLVLSAVLAGLTNFFGSLVPGLAWGQLLNFAVSFGFTTLLFALIFKVLPDVKIPWSDLWVGAGVTALLFSIGRFLIGVYLGNSSVGSTYGAAGSLIVLLLWVYYSAQILLLGAEFTQVYAKMHGSKIVPSGHAMPLDDAIQDRAGMPPHTEDDRNLPKGATHPPAPRQRSSNLGNYVASFLGSFVAVAGVLNNSQSSRRRKRRRR